MKVHKASPKHKKCYANLIYMHFAFFSHVSALLLFYITCLSVFNTPVLLSILAEVAHIYCGGIHESAFNTGLQLCVFTPVRGIYHNKSKGPQIIWRKLKGHI